MNKFETPEQKILKMNREKAQKRMMDLLNSITSKDMGALTKNDKDILKARIVYLTPEQKERYKDFLLPKKLVK